MQAIAAAMNGENSSEADPAEGESPEEESVHSPLTDLRFVPLDEIVGQEGLDPRRADRLAADIQRDGRLKHPVYISPFGDEGLFTSFDGHNRIEAFRRLGYKNILGQAIALSDIIPGTWLQMADAAVDALLDEVSSRGLSIDCSASNRMSNIVATVYAKTSRFVVCGSTRERIVRDTAIVTRAISVVAESRIERFPENDISRLLNQINGGVVVEFPKLDPRDVISAVARGEQVGAGVTRWQFQNRLLNVDLPTGDWLNESVEQLNTMLSRVVSTATTRIYNSEIVEADLRWHEYIRHTY